MSLHRFVPVPLDLEDEPRRAQWRCVGCSLVVGDPVSRLTDSCPAIALEWDE